MKLKHNDDMLLVEHIVFLQSLSSNKYSVLILVSPYQTATVLQYMYFFPLVRFQND